jgi:hypothetical protein
VFHRRKDDVLRIPPLVRRGEGGRDVQLCPIRAQQERAATSPDSVARLLQFGVRGRMPPHRRGGAIVPIRTRSPGTLHK